MTSPDGLAPRVGDSAPTFAGLCSDGQVRLLDNYRGQKLVLVFAHNIEDEPFREHAAALWAHKADFEAVGAAVLIVSSEPMARVRSSLNSAPFGWPVLADPERAIAHHYGLTPHTPSPRRAPHRTLWRSLRSLFRGNPSLPGDGSQDLEGDFLIGPSGTLEFVYRSPAGPRPSPETLLAAIRDLDRDPGEADSFP
jgi:peroxiredoxin